MGPERDASGVDALSLEGGVLCLDFCNTVNPRDGTFEGETLVSYSSLARWGRRLGALGSAELDAVLALAVANPRGADTALGRAIALRESVHRIFFALAHGGDPLEDDLTRLGRLAAAGLARARLRGRAGGYDWSWEGIVDLDRVTWAVARSAVDLLASGELRRVKECPNHGCGWLFYDASKNVSRRWCSMRSCGSVVKSRRQYERRKAERAAPEAG